MMRALTMRWERSNRFDPTVVPLADRHYNRQKIGAPQFVPPGRCLVFATPARRAFWVSSWPEYAQHAWLGAWMNTAFRNEGAGLSSELITEAAAATRYLWGDPPPLGFVTFIDASKVRRKRDPGRCYRRAGWEDAGRTKGGLVALQLLPNAFPDARPPLGELDFALDGVA